MGLYQTFHPVVFLWSLLWGGYIYVVYEVFRFIRVMSKDKKLVTIISDILFMIIASLFMFTFSLAYNFGQIRMYMLFGAFLSFLLLYLSVGRLSVVLYKAFSSISSMFLNFLSKFFEKLTSKLLKSTSFLVYNLVRKKNKEDYKKKGMKYEEQ